MNAIVSCQGVSKDFRIPISQHRSLRGRLLHPLARTEYREFDALDDVSFDVQEGEFFGIVGRNGSGKSTLLKILAGIYRPSSGRVDVNGSLAPFIELGVGFNYELSARDNVYLNGALLGLSKRQLEERYEKIVAFAELEEFMELKLANFSSGMQVRLAFAIAVESDADILMIDEVLAVGDERFQKKCFDVFRARKAAGKTVIFVSHDMGAVTAFCDRALLLQHGRTVDIGPSRQIAQTYTRLNLGKQDVRDQYDTGWIRSVEITPHRIVDETITIDHGDRMTIRATIEAQRDLEHPAVGFIINDVHGTHVIATNTNFADSELPPLRAGDRYEATFDFDNVLGTGRFAISATLEEQGVDVPLDLREDVVAFTVNCPHASGAIVQVPHAIQLTKV